MLIDKLLANVHGAPSPMTTRRAVIRLSDPPAEVTLDSVRLSLDGVVEFTREYEGADSVSCVRACTQLTILERMKRKIVADAPLYYDKPEQTIGRLHEIYSRFVKIKNLNKKKCVTCCCSGVRRQHPDVFATLTWNRLLGCCYSAARRCCCSTGSWTRPRLALARRCRS